MRYVQPCFEIESAGNTALDIVHPNVLECTQQLFCDYMLIFRLLSQKSRVDKLKYLGV